MNILSKVYCRTFQACLKLGHYFLGYRTPETKEGPGSVKKLQVNMANIRKKFGARPGENNYIVNELGVGYRMNGDN